jgi:putative redox protein
MNKTLGESASATSTPSPYRVRLQDDAGHEWWADEPVAQGGQDTAATPMHMVMAALAACTNITLQMYAQRKGWALGQVHVDCRLNPDGKPAAGQANRVLRSIHLSGELSDEQRERLLQIANACPVHKLLTGGVDLQTSLAATQP